MIEVQRAAEDSLSTTEWQFELIERHHGGPYEVRLRGYEEMVRPTKRHKFRRGGQYQDRYFCAIDSRYGMKEHEVPLPQDVVDEAMSKARALVVFRPPAQPQAAKAN